jgi:hypothetical protein
MRKYNIIYADPPWNFSSKELQKYEKKDFKLRNEIIKERKIMKWQKIIREEGRIEYICEHGVGHGNHVHGCDGCCSRPDFPLNKKKRRKK